MNRLGKREFVQLFMALNGMLSVQSFPPINSAQAPVSIHLLMFQVKFSKCVAFILRMSKCLHQNQTSKSK